MVNEKFWERFQDEARAIIISEPLLASYVHTCIINHDKFESALGFMLSNKMADEVMSAIAIREIFQEAYTRSPEVITFAAHDIEAVFNRDPAVESFLTVLLYLKGFQSLQVHRLAHYLWQTNRRELALFIQSRNSEVFAVDIHPAAVVGKGVMFDHATGIVVGETTVIEDDVSVMQSVTLGGTGNESGDRHPKIRKGVMIGSGAKILGNIEIGQGSKVGAGSVVLSSVRPHITVVGVPAKVVGRPSCQSPCETMEQNVLVDEAPVINITGSGTNLTR